jgi:LAO/AO transport system kinase
MTPTRSASKVRPKPTPAAYVEGILTGNRVTLAQAITLIESRNPEHQKLAQEVLLAVLPHAGKAQRVGITGVPGVGKSTFIDGLGTMLTGKGSKVAVMAIDPTSRRTGGSILGDKTRMARLAVDENAFIRPSPSAGTLGGVTRSTRETMLLCEAAGFDVILVETVGVGQSETVVADMVDFFLVLMIAGAGDELQGIKKGVLELADMIAVNKADGENEGKAKQAAGEYRSALHILKPASPNWTPPVMTCSGLKGLGLEKLWGQILLHRQKLTDSGELEAKRKDQQLRWMWSMLEDRLLTHLKSNEAVKRLLPDVEGDVLAGRLTPTLAVDRVLEAFEHPGD